MSTEENEFMNNRKLLSSTIWVLVLFLITQMFSLNYRSAVMGFFVRIGISYDFYHFFSRIVEHLCFIVIIFLTGFSPIAWSKGQLESLKQVSQPNLKHRKTKAFVLTVAAWFFIFFGSYKRCDSDLTKLLVFIKRQYTIQNLVFFFIAATFEEFQIKGMIYRSFLETKLPQIVSMFFTGLIYSTLHVVRYGFEASLFRYILLFASAIYSLMIFNIYPSIFLMIALHAVRNFLLI